MLIDQGSASSSEITLAALKHYETVTIIGTRSYGKGVSQSVVDLIDGSGLYITSHNILSPGGTSFHNKGIEPDIYNSSSATSPSNDPQLEAATEWLLNGSISAVQPSSTFQQRYLSLPQPWWLSFEEYR